jgi:hypothetical protein
MLFIGLCFFFLFLKGECLYAKLENCQILIVFDVKWFSSIVNSLNNNHNSIIKHLNNYSESNIRYWLYDKLKEPSVIDEFNLSDLQQLDYLLQLLKQFNLILIKSDNIQHIVSIVHSVNRGKNEPREDPNIVRKISLRQVQKGFLFIFFCYSFVCVCLSGRTNMAEQFAWLFGNSSQIRFVLQATSIRILRYNWKVSAITGYCQNNRQLSDMPRRLRKHLDSNETEF